LAALTIVCRGSHRFDVAKRLDEPSGVGDCLSRGCYATLRYRLKRGQRSQRVPALAVEATQNAFHNTQIVACDQAIVFHTVKSLLRRMVFLLWKVIDRYLGAANILFT